MAMSDQDFESVLNKLGLAQKNYSSPDQHETDATPVPADSSPNASKSAAGTPPPEAQQAFQGIADLRKADDSEPVESMPRAGFDGSPEANPNVPMPADAVDQVQQANAAIAASSQPAPSEMMPAASDTSSLGTLPNFNGSFNKSGQLSPSAASQFPGQNPELNDEALKKAQDQAKLRSLISGLGEAGGTFASEAAGKTFDPSFYREQQKEAQQPVQDIETRRNAMLNNTKVVDSILGNQLKNLSLQQRQQANDPNSDVSKTARGIIQMLHPGIQDTPGFNKLGAEDLKDFTQHILETESKLEASKASQETANELKKSALESRTQAQQAREDQQNQQMQDKISKEVNTLSQSSRNALGTAGRSLVSADRASAILNQPTVTPQDLASVSADISNIISGSATVSGTQHQEYNTLKQQADNLMQRLTSNPQNVDAPQLKQHLQEVIGGMRKISSDVASKNLNFVKTSHPAFAAKNPTYFEDIAKGLAEQTAAPEQAPASNNPTTGAYGQDVLDYAKSHNITPDQANKIKQQRTSGAQ